MKESWICCWWTWDILNFESDRMLKQQLEKLGIFLWEIFFFFLNKGHLVRWPKKGPNSEIRWNLANFPGKIQIWQGDTFLTKTLEGFMKWKEKTKQNKTKHTHTHTHTNLSHFSKFLKLLIYIYIFFRGSTNLKNDSNFYWGKT